MRLLVTGGTGFLGAALVDAALARGLDVTATHLAQPPGAAAAAWVRLDVTDADAVERAVAGARPDAVIHTAYLQGGPSMRAVTVDGAAHVAVASKRAGARLVQLSTDVIFDGEREGAYAEDDPPSPVTDYGRAKADAERAVAGAHPDAAIVRTSLLYKRSDDDRQTRVALDLLEGRARGALFSDELRCPILADDLAAALLELCERPRPGVLHVAGADVVSRHDFGAMLLRARGLDASALPSARSADQAARRPRNCALSIARARAALSTRLRGVREVL